MCIKHISTNMVKIESLSRQPPPTTLNRAMQRVHTYRPTFVQKLWFNQHTRTNKHMFPQLHTSNLHSESNRNSFPPTHLMHIGHTHIQTRERTLTGNFATRAASHCLLTLFPGLPFPLHPPALLSFLQSQSSAIDLSPERRNQPFSCLYF